MTAMFGTWAEEAACRDLPTETFFPETQPGQVMALAICRSCPVVASCRAWIDVAEGNGRQGLYGVVAGELPFERAERRRRAGARPRRRPNQTKGAAMDPVAEFRKLDLEVTAADGRQEPARWRMAEIAAEATKAMSQREFAIKVGRSPAYVSRIASLWNEYGEQANKPVFWDAFTTRVGRQVRPQYERVKERRDDPVRVAKRLGTLLPDDDAAWSPELDQALMPLFERLHAHYVRRKELMSA